MRRVYWGWLIEADWGEGQDVLWLLAGRGRRPGQYDEPLARRIVNDMERHGQYLTVRYWISPVLKTREELEIDLATWAVLGRAEAEVGHAYSEITGYLWTNEQIEVGGHDLIAEMHSHVGKFCRLEIEYAKAPPDRRPRRGDTIFPLGLTARRILAVKDPDRESAKPHDRFVVAEGMLQIAIGDLVYNGGDSWREVERGRPAH